MKTRDIYLGIATAAATATALFFFTRKQRIPLYRPHSPEAIALFTEAARKAGLSESWAREVGLHEILAKESGGYVGRPNYQFGDLSKLSNQSRWFEVWDAIKRGTWRDILAEPYRSGAQSSQSSATGLGQLTVTNLKILGGDGKPIYYPSGVMGVGNALEEAIGMMKYIEHRYGTPQNAWESYGKGHEGY